MPLSGAKQDKNNNQSPQNPQKVNSNAKYFDIPPSEFNQVHYLKLKSQFTLLFFFWFSAIIERECNV